MNWYNTPTSWIPPPTCMDSPPFPSPQPWSIDNAYFLGILSWFCISISNVAKVLFHSFWLLCLSRYACLSHSRFNQVWIDIIHDMHGFRPSPPTMDYSNQRFLFSLNFKLVCVFLPSICGQVLFFRFLAVASQTSCLSTEITQAWIQILHDMQWFPPPTMDYSTNAFNFLGILSWFVYFYRQYVSKVLFHSFWLLVLPRHACLSHSR